MIKFHPDLMLTNVCHLLSIFRHWKHPLRFCCSEGHHSPVELKRIQPCIVCMLLARICCTQIKQKSPIEKKCVSVCACTVKFHYYYYSAECSSLAHLHTTKVFRQWLDSPIICIKIHGIRMITKQSKEITHHSLLSLCYACVQKQTNPTTIYTTGCDIWLLKTRIKKTIFKKTTRRRRWLACDLALARASLRSKGKEGGAVARARTRSISFATTMRYTEWSIKKECAPFFESKPNTAAKQERFFLANNPFLKTLQH